MLFIVVVKLLQVHFTCATVYLFAIIMDCGFKALAEEDVELPIIPPWFPRPTGDYIKHLLNMSFVWRISLSKPEVIGSRKMGRMDILKTNIMMDDSFFIIEPILNYIPIWSRNSHFVLYLIPPNLISFHYHN